uniref:Chromosome 11 open reading frame 42 n=1 Tax=Naja naja TaxID=35670 RepID=A0A8C6XXX5_NAJNA
MDGGGSPSLKISEADANWELIRDKVIEERFGPSVVPVPFLEDAASYDLLTVLIKKPQLRQSLLHRQCCLVPIGPLESLLPSGPAPRELTHCTREYSARVRGESRYEETRLVDGALRHIRFCLAGVHKKVAFLALRPGTVALRPDLPWLRSQHSLYVVHEVFYASNLSLAITQEAEHRHFIQETPLPLAFACLKFTLSHKGVLGSQKPMGHSLPTRAAWMRMAMLEASPPARALEAPLITSGPADQVGLEEEEDLGFSGGRERGGFSLGAPAMTPSLFCIPTGKWPFKQRRPKLGFSCSSLADPERHCMSLPLLQSITATESDTEE